LVLESRCRLPLSVVIEGGNDEELPVLDSRCSLPLSVVIEGGNDASKQYQGSYEFINLVTAFIYL
jgi:hypothetical protein